MQENTKLISYSSEGRQKIANGVNKLADAVKVTLGASGRNVVIQREYGAPIITKDGVTVAREVILKDPEENLGATIIREVAQKTVDKVGDGTSTATVLAQAILNNGLYYIAKGMNSVDLKRGIDLAVADVVKELRALSKEISSKSDILNIAKISSNNDTVIAEMISRAIEQVGRKGVITVSDSKTSETNLEIVEGIEFESGYLTPYFVTNYQKMTVEMKNPLILFYGGVISHFKGLDRIMEMAINQSRPLVIIADDINGEALQMLVMNKLEGVLQSVAIKAPSFGDRRKEMMKDMAILTGATYIEGELGLDISKVENKHLGKASSVTVYNDSTVIVDGRANPEQLNDRVLELNVLLEDVSLNEYERKRVSERLAQLTNGIAVIHVGASSELELSEKKDRLDDAIHAVKAGIDEGILAGGGSALVHVYHKLSSKKNKSLKKSSLTMGEIMGYDLVLKSILAPCKCIVENAGKEPNVVVENLLKKNSNIGYDVRSESYVDMFKVGIVDPLKVTRLALENASSVAGMLLTTEAIITIEPKELSNNKNNKE